MSDISNIITIILDFATEISKPKDSLSKSSKRIVIVSIILIIILSIIIITLIELY